MEVLHPPFPLLKGTSDDIDNNGLVLRLNWAEISFLLAADIKEEAEWYLIAHRANLKSNILKVAHHGSRTSTSAEFLSVVDPQVAIISVENDNRFGHPHPEILSRLIQRVGKDKLFLTSESGTIEFISDGDKLWVKTEFR